MKMDYKYIGAEKRAVKDRRKSLKGNPVRSESGEEKRKGARRWDDILITLEIRDDDSVFVNRNVFREIVRKLLQTNFPECCGDSDENSLMNLDYGSEEIYLDTKMGFRNKIKELIQQKGLSVEVIKMGAYLGERKKHDVETEHVAISDKKQQPVKEKDSAMSAILGFTTEQIERETENILFKVFVRCLNEVHPVSGDYQRDALKQDVGLEQQIIFIAGKHYPKSEKYTYKTIIEQVFTEVINEYNRMIQLEAEIMNLEERFKLSADQRLKEVVRKKKEEVEAMRQSSLEDSVRILYLYLTFFKDLVKVNSTRERIENVFRKVNERKVEIITLDEFQTHLVEVLAAEKKVKQDKPENLTQLLGYFKWLKDEISNEIYFIRFLWSNNLRGRSYITDAINRTLKAALPGEMSQ